MEKINFVKNGELKMPPGFRFHPTDQELVLSYLKRKVFSLPFPAAIIPEADLCKSDPWDLPGDLEQERYFFSTKEAKYPKGNRSNRATNSGYWKATGLDKQIIGWSKLEVVGMKKTLVFYSGKPPHGSRTDWIMHEYRLAPSHSNPLNENWVLCRIFLKKRAGTKTASVKPNMDINNLTHHRKPSVLAVRIPLSTQPTTTTMFTHKSSPSAGIANQRPLISSSFRPSTVHPRSPSTFNRTSHRLRFNSM